MSPILLLFVILAVVLGILLAALTHAGLFYQLRIRTVRPRHLPRRAAYRLYRGPYKKAGGAYRAVLADAPLETAFAVFYDCPDTVSHIRVYRLRMNTIRPINTRFR